MSTASPMSMFYIPMSIPMLHVLSVLYGLEHAALTHVHGHIAYIWTRGMDMDMQHVLGMQHGHEHAAPLDINMQHGH
jgi:hypothetical protein